MIALLYNNDGTIVSCGQASHINNVTGFNRIEKDSGDINDLSSGRYLIDIATEDIIDNPAFTEIDQTELKNEVDGILTDLKLHDWQNSGEHLYYNSGRVGINTDDPQGDLHVAGQILAQSVSRNYVYGASYGAHDFTSATWTNLIGLDPLEITTFGRPLKVSMEFSAYGIHHGGLRLVMDDRIIYGKNDMYGLDWIIPSNNVWEKKSILRVFDDIDAGEHSFMVQVRSQAEGSRFYIAGGNEEEDYSGFHIMIEEL